METTSPADNLSLITSHISKAKRILIIPNTKHNQDIIYASLALSQYLNNEERNSYVLSNTLTIDRIWKFKIKGLKIENIYEKIPTQFAIQFKKESLEVTNVSLKTNDDVYQIILDTKTNSISNEVPINSIFKEIVTDFDLIFIIGSPSLEILLGYGMSEKQILHSNLIFISNSNISNTVDLPNVITYHGSSPSYSQKILNLFHDIKQELTPDLATLLLSGILSFSDNFSKNISVELFNSISQLINLGADYFQAKQLGLQNLSYKNFSLISEIYSNIKKLDIGIYYSKNTNVSFNPRSIEYQELLRFSNAFDCRLAFVYLTSKKGQVVYFKCSDSSIKLKKLLKKLNGKGNNYDGVVHTELNLEDFLVELQELMTGKNSTIQSNPLSTATDIPNPLEISKLLKERNHN